jgi:hypothetical protein
MARPMLTSRSSLPPLRFVAAAIVSLTLAGGCSGVLHGTAPSPGVSQPVHSTGSDAGPSPGNGAHGDLVASDDRLSMTVSFKPGEVAPGGSLEVHLVVHNISSEPVVLADACGTPHLVASVLVPVEPVGRHWDGIAGAFKTYALQQGLGPIDHPEATSNRVDVTGVCDHPGSDTLAPGASTSASFSWKADLARTMPVPAGVIPIHVAIDAIPAEAPASAAPSNPPSVPPSDPPQGVGSSSGGGLVFYEELSVDGVIRIVGDPPPFVSAGQALDKILADRKFTAWLAKQPKKTWSAVHVFLVDQYGAGGIVPNGPSWDIELFREIGVARNWAIGFVHPLTGKLSNLTFCNEPCDR